LIGFCRITGIAMNRLQPLVTLKTRAEFLRIRGGVKWSGTGFLIETKPALQPGPPRFGFTVTKKLGNAVVRNRIRRRLKEAVRLNQIGPAAASGAQASYDYVIVARKAALVMPFEVLQRDLLAAWQRLHRSPKLPTRAADA
jgi:ribonuclease P protein component